MNGEDLGWVWQRRDLGRDSSDFHSITLLWEKKQPGRAHSGRTCPLWAWIHEVWVTCESHIYEWSEQSPKAARAASDPTTTHSKLYKPSHVQPNLFLRHRVPAFPSPHFPELPSPPSRSVSNELLVPGSHQLPEPGSCSADLGWVGHPGCTWKAPLKSADKLYCHNLKNDLKLLVAWQWRFH